MNDQQPGAEQETLKREAYQWLARLTSGAATTADAEALDRWRQTSQAHRQAFGEANLLWEKLGAAAVDSAARHVASTQDALGMPSPTSNSMLGRRAFLSGGIATATAVAAGYVVVRPPLDFWPSLAALASDYRTGVGQQQQIAFKDNVSVKLNTRTSIALLSPELGTDQADRIELITGEALVRTAPETSNPFIVVAAQGKAIATNSRFNVRHDGARVCVTCIDGDVRVEHLGQVSKLRSRQQVVYSAYNLGTVASVDPETVTAWERGLLVFRNDPIARVIEEVNRYRPGKIILMDENLGRRPVLATFRIDRIEEVVPRLQAVFGVHIKTFPGGIVLVS